MRKAALTIAAALMMGVSPAAGPLTAPLTRTPPETPIGDPMLGLTSMRLWEGSAPDARGASVEDVPTLTIFRPYADTEVGTAVIVAPGGAYRGLAGDLEGRQVADWFAARGVTAFVLRYRLGAKYLHPVPLGDAQRAIRLVRSHAAAFRIMPDRIGIMGFSAGGHLAALAATASARADERAADPADRRSARPDFLVLGYPALSMFAPGQTSEVAYCRIMAAGKACDRAYLARFSPERHVTAATPPTFLYHTSDDALVPVEDSLTFYRALRAAGVQAEMHLFRSGVHGSGLGRGDPKLGKWPELLEQWLRGLGLMDAPPPNEVAR